MNPNTTRVVAATLALLAFLLAVLGTVTRYAHGKPTDYTALIGAVGCVFFLIVVLRKRPET